MFKRKFDQGIAAVNSQLLTDVSPVILDRAVADEQLGGNLLAGFMLTDQSQYAQFRRSEILQARFLLAQGGGSA